MTKEDPDQLINVGPYLVPIGQLIERSGWSYQETLDYAAIAVRPSSLPLPPPDAAVQERVSLRATFTEHSSNESDDLLVGVLY